MTRIRSVLTNEDDLVGEYRAVYYGAASVYPIEAGRTFGDRGYTTVPRILKEAQS